MEPLYITRGKPAPRKATDASAEVVATSRPGKGLPQLPAFLQSAAGPDRTPALAAAESAARIHTGSEAASAAETHDAVAFTQGRDVYLGASVDPESDSGLRVLAHELTHVAQQERGRDDLPRGTEASLESEARVVSGVGKQADGNTGGAAQPGSVQRLNPAEAQGVPASLEQDNAWAAEFSRDEARLLHLLTGFVYSDDDEGEVLQILWRWAMRRTGAVEQAGLGMRSDLLDRLFEKARATSTWTRTGPSTAYEAMFAHFDRAKEVRTIRDTFSISYVGREQAQDEAAATKQEEDLLAESLLGWQVNTIEASAPASSPQDTYMADLVIARLTALEPQQLTPESRLLSEGVAREGRNFLLRRTHVVTAGDRLRFGKELVRSAVVLMLEFALWELGMGAARAVAPELLGGIAGAETAGARSVAAGESELAAAGNLEAATSRSAVPKSLGENVISIEGVPRTGTIEGLSAAEREVTHLSDFRARKTGVPPTPSEPAAQALPKAAAEDLKVGESVSQEIPREQRMRKAAGDFETAEPTIASVKKGKISSPTTQPQIQMTEAGSTGTVEIDPRVVGGASEVAQLDNLNVTKLNNWFKTLDAHYGGTSTLSVQNGKVIVEFSGGTGVSIKATTLSDAASNLAYLEEKMNKAADTLNSFTSWKRTESGVTHVVSGIENRELHLIIDSQARIENERQVFRVMEKIKKDLGAKGVDFQWFVDTLDGRRYAGPQWHERYLAGQREIREL